MTFFLRLHESSDRGNFKDGTTEDNGLDDSFFLLYNEVMKYTLVMYGYEDTLTVTSFPKTTHTK